eukprot:GHVU01102207.1.p1 GENE.GHVU01102207.1~~GHVU01102207.1.p1  ORF type:complete len:169 (-),score=19.13 GHVU01102207.1:692-1198(-)
MKNDRLDGRGEITVTGILALLSPFVHPLIRMNSEQRWPEAVGGGLPRTTAAAGREGRASRTTKTRPDCSERPVAPPFGSAPTLRFPAHATVRVRSSNGCHRRYHCLLDAYPTPNTIIHHMYFHCERHLPIRAKEPSIGHGLCSPNKAPGPGNDDDSGDGDGDTVTMMK